MTDIAADGAWLLADDRERFMPYEHFPWFG